MDYGDLNWVWLITRGMGSNGFCFKHTEQEWQRDENKKYRVLEKVNDQIPTPIPWRQSII
jgi:hypothetical protein